MTYSLSSLEKKGGVITGSGLIGVRGEGGGGASWGIYVIRLHEDVCSFDQA